MQTNALQLVDNFVVCVLLGEQGSRNDLKYVVDLRQCRAIFVVSWRQSSLPPTAAVNRLIPINVLNFARARLVEDTFVPEKGRFDTRS